MKAKLFWLCLAGFLLAAMPAKSQVPLTSKTMTAYNHNSYSDYWYLTVNGIDKAKAYFSENRISDEDLETLKLRTVRHNFLKAAPAERIIKGETISNTDKGTAVLVHALQDKVDGNGFNYIYDYLITYDKNGNYVDSKLVGETGVMDTYMDPRKKFWVFGDQNAFYTEEDMGGESEILGYTINNAMKIVRKS